MLKIHFFNVAEGDAALLEYEGGSKPFRVLVDTGRSILPESEGSLRQTADRHLRDMGIDFIDVLVITHLHVDHVQDLPVIMESVRFGKIYSTYFPKPSADRIPPVRSELKAVRELPEDLNTLLQSIRIAQKSGTECCLVTEDTFIPLEASYGDILIRMPAENTLAFQNSVCDRLFAAGSLSEEEIWRAAKSRNSNSLRLRVTYADRVIALDGDYYACDAEKEEQQPCDILKVAHHGDKKSMTEKLASMLRPKIAVISCMREYVPKKDRPSAAAADLLRGYGAEICYTDCFAEEGQEPARHKEVLVTINETGAINLSA